MQLRDPPFAECGLARQGKHPLRTGSAAEWTLLSLPLARDEELFPAQRSGVQAAAPFEVAIPGEIAVFDRVLDHANELIDQGLIGREIGEIVQHTLAAESIAIFGFDAIHTLKGFNHLSGRDHVADNRDRLAVVPIGVREHSRHEFGHQRI